MGWKVGEICDGNGFGPDLSRQLAHFLVRTFEKFVQNAQFLHNFKRGRMDSISAEITEEVGMRLQYHNIHAGARQEKAQHHAGGTASDDAATCTQRFAHESEVEIYPGTGSQEQKTEEYPAAFCRRN